MQCRGQSAFDTSGAAATVWMDVLDFGVQKASNVVAKSEILLNIEPAKVMAILSPCNPDDLEGSTYITLLDRLRIDPSPPRHQINGKPSNHVPLSSTGS